MSKVTAAVAASCFFHAKRSNGELLDDECCQLLLVAYFGTAKVALLKADQKSLESRNQTEPQELKIPSVVR